MATKKKMLQAAAGNAGGEALNVEDVFSTYLYTGTNGSLTVNNGIDLDGEGGMVWHKGRDITESHNLFDTERGDGYILRTESTQASDGPFFGQAFTSTGFNLNTSDNQINSSSNTYASWTFRKAPRFFDVVTYTGDWTVGRTVAHNLGVAPAVIIVKSLSEVRNWFVYHRSLGATKHLHINTSDGEAIQTDIWNDTEPTDTHFTLGDSSDVNSGAGGGQPYVAYLFAHNDGDGEFGPDGDDDIIKCGSFDQISGSVEVDVGFEPQFLLIKNATNPYSNPGDWFMWDTMRGYCAPDGATNGTGGNAQALFANTSGAEVEYEYGGLTPNGFVWPSNFAYGITPAANYIYIAIRRGTKVPESGTEVFAPALTNNGPEPSYTTDFITDFGLQKLQSGGATYSFSRITGNGYMITNETGAENTGPNVVWDYMDGFGDSNANDYKAWFWKRAPGFFDVVAYTGVSGADTVSHNLGVVPEMIWVKSRTEAVSIPARGNWVVYHKDVSSGYLNLHDTVALQTADAVSKFGNGSTLVPPTDTNFTVADDYDVGRSANNYIAYLFASLDGVSKVGSYTGNGSSQTIDCGFSSGARFILVKRTDSAGDWYVWDTERGIVAGNDPYLELNTTDAEVTSTDWVDPDSSGFIVNGTTINASSAEYIFYAVA